LPLPLRVPAPSRFFEGSVFLFPSSPVLRSCRRSPRVSLPISPDRSESIQFSFSSKTRNYSTASLSGAPPVRASPDSCACTPASPLSSSDSTHLNQKIAVARNAPATPLRPRSPAPIVPREVFSSAAAAAKHAASKPASPSKAFPGPVRQSANERVRA